jgi:hypothetical protein
MPNGRRPVRSIIPTQTLFNQGDLHGTYDIAGLVLVALVWTDSTGLDSGRAVAG